jgi:hypothetical protein
LSELAWVDLFFTYFLLQLKEFNDDLEETRTKRINMYSFIWHIIQKYEEELKRTSMAVRLKYYVTIRNDMPKYKLTIEKVLWNDFIKALGDSAGKDLSWLLLIE